MTTEPQQSRPDDEQQPDERGRIPMDSFANRLMLARAHAGHLSIREAAELCDLGRGAWTNWEKGTLPGDIIDVASVVAEKLHVDREWLLFGGMLTRTEAGHARRRGRSRLATERYPAVAIQMGRQNPAIADRPIDNRPSGRAHAATAPGRTGYVTRRKRDR